MPRDTRYPVEDSQSQKPITGESNGIHTEVQLTRSLKASNKDALSTCLVMCVEVQISALGPAAAQWLR